MDWTEDWQTILTISLMTSYIQAELLHFMRALWWDDSPAWCSIQAQSYLCCDWGLPRFCLWFSGWHTHSTWHWLSFCFHVTVNIKFRCPSLWFKQNQFILVRCEASWGMCNLFAYDVSYWRSSNSRWMGLERKLPNQRKICSSQVRFSEYFLSIWFEMKSSPSQK